MREDGPDSGWNMVAHWDESAALIGAIVALDADRTYTRSELAEAADVPLKTLYLVDTLEHLVAVGLLERVDDGEESEASYALDEDSDVLVAARRFDEAVEEQMRGVEAD